jgi:TonB-linked SusC/RagA family outer membrane protein
MMKKLYKKLSLTAVILLVLTSVGFAQERVISGTVKDENGSTLPGVNVLVKGTSTGTVSDGDGNFKISVSNDQAILIFTFVGYATSEVVVGSKSVVDVSLLPDVQTLNEVIVTALGVERNTKALQSSITKVGGENFTQAREVNLGASLAGRIAGVNVTKTGAGAAGSSRVIIRGNKSIFGSNQPLYVIDGVPMDNSGFGQAGVWGGQDQGDGLSSINPDDIESISVLKGVSATALYGSRGGAGVILVTTKKGKSQKGLGIDFNSNYVFETVMNQTDLQQEFGSGNLANSDPLDPTSPLVGSKPLTRTQAFNNGDQAWGARLDGSSVIQYDGVSRPYAYAGDNWKRFYDVGKTFTNSIGINGGNDKQAFRFGFSNLTSNGVIPNSGFDRRNLTLATNGKLGEKLNFNAKVLYSNEKTKNRTNLADSPGNPVQAVYRLAPNYNVENLMGDPNKLGAVPLGFATEDGKNAGEELQTSPNLWGQNPYWAAHQFINSDTRDRFITSAQLRYDITDYLYVSGRVGMDWFTRRNTALTPQGTGFQRAGSTSQGQNNVREINQEWILGFNKTFNLINVNAFVGGNKMERKSESISANGSSFNIPFYTSVTNTASQSFGFGYGASGINSLFGSAEVSYNNYLFLTATGRKDWFSVLNPEQNAQFYPSIGTSFVFSDAFNNLPTQISFGKIRASWGQSASATVNAYDVNLAYGLNGQGHLGRPMGQFRNTQVIPNPFITPATSTEIELGFDMRFLSNRVGIDFAYYSQKTTDDIVYANISIASGFNQTLLNIAELTNKGFEILISGTPVKGDLTWDISLNLAQNKNKIIAINGDQERLRIEEPRTRTVAVEHIKGYSFGMITGWKQKLSPEGQPIFNANGTPVQSDSYEILGNGIAKLTGGLTNSLTYKNFNLTALMDFKFGGDIYSGTNVRLTQWGLHKQTLEGRPGHDAITVNGVIANGVNGNGETVYDPFTKTLNEEESKNYWNAVGNVQQDRFMYDASFIKLRQITFGYNIPNSLLSKTPVKTLGISFVARNLAVLFKNTENIDPESAYSSSGGAQGVDYFGMPLTRSYGFNLRATF